MTYQEFCKALKKTPRRWYFRNINGYPCIRQRGTNRCPLEVVTRKRAGSAVTDAIGVRILGLTSCVELQIMGAADSDTRLATIRRDLLRACGLKEK